ncbi:MAG: hypothetical protein JWP74_789 [Marmoricola sp.]|nr:hypothetical protein [Marmoricola sp.]
MNETGTLAPAVIDVATWDDLEARSYHDEVWSAWLHGSVAAVNDTGRVLLLVPVAILTPAVIAFALRLYEVGSVTVLG